MHPFVPLAGGIVGFSLGLTGGGGAIFAVPLLVYVVGTTPRDAVGISLATVGITSFIGTIRSWRGGALELPTGFLFAAAGALGTPAGAWLAQRVPEPVLLTLFGLLMLIVAARMWKRPVGPTVTPASVSNPPDPHLPIADSGPACERNDGGRLLMTTRCRWLLLALGLFTGLLSGLFGVGGGFIIVPALVLFSGMAMNRAVGTSLFVITLLSAAGLGSQWLIGNPLDWSVILPFSFGSLGGLLLGNRINRLIPETAMRRTFAAAILVVALFVIAKNTIFTL